MGAARTDAWIVVSAMGAVGDDATGAAFRVATLFGGALFLVGRPLPRRMPAGP